jgi:hypothetical protein
MGVDNHVLLKELNQLLKYNISFSLILSNLIEKGKFIIVIVAENCNSISTIPRLPINLVDVIPKITFIEVSSLLE